MAISRKKAVLMRAVSDLKDADYSAEPELNRIYRRLSDGRTQFAQVFEKNINAVMQISSLDLMMQHQTEEILDISRRVTNATETIFGNAMGSSNNKQEELTDTIVRVSEETNEVYRKIEAGQNELTTIKDLSNQTIAFSLEMQKDMDELVGIINQISEVISGINSISLQTNLLALNASVEAARAGSAGAGFAVVAEEVKELAGKSAQAAQSAVEIVSNTRAVIQTGVELNASTAESLQAIFGVSTEIREMSDQLVAAVHGQEDALNSIEERIETISAIADRNLQNAGGTNQSSVRLAQEAEELQAQVRKFALKEG